MNPHPRIWTLTLSLLWAGGLLGSLASSAPAQSGLLRYPDLHDHTVAFSYGGDLWTVSDQGGTARRITAHPGRELFPRFSPDGRSIAFMGQYDGDEQVYVIPTEGGVPRQLTFYPARGPLPTRWGFDNQVYGWTRDGQAVLFRSLRHGWDLTDTRLYTVPLAGGLPTPLPMPVSGGGDLSPDGKHVVYSPLTRDFRAWKRYQGGWAQDLYIFDLLNKTARQITSHPRTERDPMWIGNTIYFASDRTGTLNIFGYDVSTGRLRQVTHSKHWDVRWPSRSEDGRIVYELAGQLNILDPQSGATFELNIQVPSDELATRPRHISVAGAIEQSGLSPHGKRVLFAARGDIFSVPAKVGPTRNLTAGNTAHAKWPVWSPDGKQVAFISDRSGEEEIYVTPEDGRGKAIALTKGGQAMRFRPRWSPDASLMAFSDKDGKLYVLTVKDGALKQIADEERGSLNDFSWSPDSRYLAFSKSDPNEFKSLYIWSRTDSRVRRITGSMFDERNPVFGAEGRYLYFLSRREYVPQIASEDWNYALDRDMGIFAMALRKDVPHPFPPKSDEVEIAKTPKPEKKAQKKEDSKSPQPIQIDFEGLAQRVVRVPVAADNYQDLRAKKGLLVYGVTGPFFYGRKSSRTPEIRLFDLKKRKVETLVKGAAGYSLSHDGTKLLTRVKGSFQIFDVALGKKSTAQKVSTSGLKTVVIPKQEYREIFDEVWRRYRDYFYAKNMNGYDWQALKKQYGALLKYVVHRSDLNYVISEMIAELNIGHAYIMGGDFDIPPRPKVALPGAEFVLDAARGRYRIKRILPGQNEEARYRSPLTEVGVHVDEGDYVLAINGQKLLGSDNPYRLLRYRADAPVRLLVNKKPEKDGAHEAVFRPLTSESSLRYLDFVTRNRKMVEKLSEGRLGYIHIPDMGAEGLSEFIKTFYPQIRKEGLIIDVRNNGGGNVSQMILARLSRKLLATEPARTRSDMGTYPAVCFYGHMACLINGNSASDGDIFPSRFQAAGLGPLIGKRTWGGVTGISNHGPLLDGGQVRVPEFGICDPHGHWIIEGHGVDPDIEVENKVEALLQGRDPQIERAIKEVLQACDRNPKKLPPRPADPIKTQ